MNRTRVRHGRATLAVCAVLIGAAWAGPAVRALTADDPVRVSRHAYVVRQGDTLWSIARRLAKGEDPRPLVDAISLANDIDAGEIVPGQTLLVSGA